MLMPHVLDESPHSRMVGHWLSKLCLSSCLPCTLCLIEFVSFLGVYIKQKSCRLSKDKRTQQEYIKIDKSIRYAIKQLEKGKGTKTVSREPNVT